MSPRRPPALARGILGLLPRPHGDFIAADLEEEYAGSVLPVRGALRADVWFWGQTLRTLVAFAAWRRSSGLPVAVPPLLREARHAYRGLRRRPGFALVATLTLAVGIGATSSVFSVADAVLFRPVSGVDRQEELVTVRFRDERDGATTGFSLPTLQGLAAASPGAATMAGYQPFLLQVAGDGIPARIAWGHLVTGDYFELLGVRAARGRLFSAEEADRQDGPTVAVASDAFWRNVLGADPSALGRNLRINGTLFTIIGVVPPDFRGVERMDSLELWLPGSAYTALRHGESVPTWRLNNRAARFFNNALARLGPGTTPEALQQQLRVAMAGLVEAYPDDNKAYETMLPTVETDIGLDDRDRASLAPTLRILTALVVVILLVTCANVANLLVLQGLRRQGETALRQALGAARTHLVLLHVAEALLLALPAAVVGLGIAVLINAALWGTGLFPAEVARHVSVDVRVFLFAAGTAGLTAVVFGLLPFVLTARQDPQASLKGTRPTAGRTATLLQGGLSVAQLSLSLALVGGALLLGATATNLAQVEVGFSPDHVVALEFDPGPQGYDRAATSGFQRAILDRSKGLPGVEAAAVSGFAPFGRLYMQLSVRSPLDGADDVTVQVDWVTEGFFDVLDVPLVAGRGITEQEATPGAESEPKATVLSLTLAEQLFGAPQRALNQTLEAEAFGDQYVLEVVGVAADIVDGDLRRGPRPKLYTSLPDSPQPWATLLIRTRRHVDEVAADVRDVFAVVDPNVPLSAVQALTQRVDRATARERAFVQLSALLAALALLLAGVGLYSVVAYAAAERKREFGIRIAVGASSARIGRLVLRRALAFGGLGVAFGLLLTGLGARLLDSVLYGVAPTDPGALAAAAALLLVVALAASLAPAVGATRVDPAATFRVE